MTPAEDLFAAVTRLRETAAKASTGPWQIRHGNEVSSNVADYNGDLIIDGGGTLAGGKAVVYGAALTADAAWIVLVNPLLAEPLADWLEKVAKSVDRHDPVEDGCYCTVEDSYHQARLVAHEINRGGRTS